MEVKKEKGRSQGALKLFCPKTNFPFQVCPNFNSCKLKTMLCAARQWPDMAQQATIVFSAKLPGTNGLIMLCCNEKKNLMMVLFSPV